MGMLLTACGFGMVWHIWWLVIVTFLATIVTYIKRCYDNDIDYYVQPDEIEKIENEHIAAVQSTLKA